MLLLLPIAAHAQVITNTTHGVVVAHDHRVELLENNRLIWETEAPDATSIVVSSDRIAILDALANQARILDLATGRGRVVRTGETPVAGVFHRGSLYLLERDARALARIGADGTRASVAVAADPAFLTVAGGDIYVYSRSAGVLQEIDPERFVITRSVRIAPFASDMESDGRTAYLLYPRDAKLRTVALPSLKVTTLDVGAVPVDRSITQKSTALTARTLAIADPSAKKVWMVEGTQSMSQAVARGFLRGLLGLGLFSSRSSQFPTGVDRVSVRGSRWFAYDSSSGTLYRFTKSGSTPLAKDLPPGAWTPTADGVAVWQNGGLRFFR